MKCPSLRVDDRERSGYPVPTAPDCLQEECAWWDKKHGICGELTKTKALVEISHFLGDIASKTLPGRG